MTRTLPDTGPFENTDREIWRGPDEGTGAFYADSLHITKEGALGINCGGYVVVKPIREWHKLASQPGDSATIEACASLIIELTLKHGKATGTDYEQGVQDHGYRLLHKVHALASPVSSTVRTSASSTKPGATSGEGVTSASAGARGEKPATIDELVAQITPENIHPEFGSDAVSQTVPTRCEICDWTLADSWENGCVPGNCSYRPDDPVEQARIRARRDALQQLVCK